MAGDATVPRSQGVSATSSRWDGGPSPYEEEPRHVPFHTNITSKPYGSQ